VFTPRLSFVMLAALCLLAPPGHAQSQPTFRSTVDLLTIETSVRDKSGPVPDLQASDFTVTIDGKPRKVVSAVFFKADAAAGRITGGAPPTPRHVSNDQAEPGRVVVFAVDADTIRGNQERALFETASRMLEALSPADAVGLVEIRGPGIEVTRDHSAVAAALKRFRGRAPGEAAELGQGNNPLGTPFGANAIVPMLGLKGREHAEKVLLDLARLLRGMTVVRAPRTVILIAGELALDRELMSDYKALQRAAAESRTVLYTVLLEDVGYEVSRGETRPEIKRPPGLVPIEDPGIVDAVAGGKAEGLATIASMTGGMFFHGVGTAAGVFDRIRSEVSSFYQLGLESSPADADGKQHDVKVRVSRTGLDVRAPSYVAVPKPSSQGSPRDPLLVALRQPTDVPDVPLAVTTYSTHGAGNAIQVLVSGEIGTPNGAAPAEWGLVVTQNGKDVAIRRGKFTAGPAGWRVVSSSVEVPPGNYRLRLAAVDAEDRIGALEIPFTARVQTASGTTLSDLVVGVATAGELEARRRLARSETLTAMLEVRTAAGDMAGGTLQLIPSGSARSVLNIPLAPRPASSSGGPAILQGRAPLEAVPPGRYTASVAVQVAGQPLTRIDRVIEITGALTATAQPDAVAAPRTEAAAAKPAPPKAAVDPSNAVPDEVMRSVGDYVGQYGGQASLLVAVEHYSQTVTRLQGISETRSRGRSTTEITNVPAGKRTLVSEFALMPNAAASGGWLGYRDVMEVDGKPVADRGGRLQALFRSDTPDLQAARRIADEGARYNIGSVSRNFNAPTTVLFFFHAGNLPRFSFRRSGRDRIDGVDTLVIDFHEDRIPTLIMNSSGKDVPASGTLWVNPADGSVVRSRLELREFDSAGSKATVDVVYRKDPAVGMWVPSRMTERYTAGTETTTTIATYTDFKRFQTSIKIK
jgi:VWFA-related protein